MSKAHSLWKLLLQCGALLALYLGILALLGCLDLPDDAPLALGLGSAGNWQGAWPGPVAVFPFCGLLTRPRTLEYVPSAARLTGPPIFISGCNRGGTTLLTRLLSAHPEVRSVGRGEFCEGQYIWRRQFPDWTRHRWAVAPWGWFMRHEAAHATPARIRFFREAFLEAMEGEGRLLEKTPANAVRIPFIDRLFPDSCFVHLVRDGRHTTASLAARRVWLPYAPHQWVGAHRTALSDLALLPADRVVIVQYEDLVASPEKTLARICTGCGLDWGGQARDAVQDAARRMVREVENRWGCLTPFQKQYVLSVIGPLQRELGYPVEL